MATTRRRRGSVRALATVERTVRLRADGRLTVGVVADTHSRPHEATLRLLARERPDVVLHAGDIGDLDVLDGFEATAPLIAVRGNIDGHADALPDVVVLRLLDGEAVVSTWLLTHIAVYGPRLRADVRRLVEAHAADLVVCGHSHVPLKAVDRGVPIFNPGSCGPRRFRLPILFGVVDVGPRGVSLRHIDCETGATWVPEPRM